MITRIVSIAKKLRVWGLRGILDYAQRQIRYRRQRQFFIANARKHPITPQRGITIVGDLSSQLSTAKTLRDFINALQKADIPVQTFDIDPNPDGNNPNLTNPRDFKSLKYDHFIEMWGSPFPDFPGIQRHFLAFWEFDSGLPEAFPALISDVPLIGMSDFNYEYFKKVLPHGTPVYKILYPFFFEAGALKSAEVMRAQYGIGSDEFVVFFNFDFGSSFGRKNPDGAMRAFAKAFADEPRARLVFKTMRAKQFHSAYDKLQSLAISLNIKQRVTFINNYIPQRDLYGLTAACDCYLSLHRGEGFGLGIAEAMSLGKPVVVTDYSATTEFCKPDNSFPVPFKLVQVLPKTQDHPSYFRVSRWAEADIDAAAQILRKLFENPQLRAETGARAKSFIARYFSTAAFRESVQEFLKSSSGTPQPTP